jgi:peptidoglycan/LPS O-acetylase OafA/YrhL
VRLTHSGFEHHARTRHESAIAVNMGSMRRDCDGATRLYSLDALRGVAALSVVIWHWQHFYALTGTWQAVWHREDQPFYWLLKPLYLEGWAAVDLFFALSGFVFFWLYARPIAERKIAPGAFALRRFSRLYPLYLVTLFAVLILQAMFHYRTGAYFIFPAGDLGRFVANLALVQQWVPPNIEQTFNGPAWTVSIEAGLYVLFFALCRVGLRGFKTAAVVAIAGASLFTWNWFVARGLMGFFLGGVCYFAYAKIKTLRSAKPAAIILAALALALWVLVFVEILCGPLHALFSWTSDQVPDDWDFYSENRDTVFHLLYIFTVIPVTIVALALQEAVLGGFSLYKPLSKLGDISYATYMLHFPLQIACALGALALGLTPAFFMHDASMLAFYAVLIGLGALVHRKIERPVQAFLRALPKR